MIKFNKVNIRFEDRVLYDDFSIDFEENTVNFIMGESGIGKSTLTKYIKDILLSKGNKVSVVFQESRLIPWKNVYKNLDIVIKNKLSKDERKAKINDILQKMNLLNCKYLYPYELSGGMRQRVNIARAVIYDADIFIMDEPFKGLDKENKENIIKYIKQYFYDNKKTAIIISHDINEAKEFTKKIIFLKNEPVKKEIIEV
ncbi:MAG: ATP-binding cassette domain-containing protein [Clostridium sp.]|uniref:ATP-binding cassette domain-containing protein n=1 Tax=Clostridium sp. TaxID=1506 RepID=UPI001EB49A00|nr:ATP-binding cassette domain-containing protein [Clostridium sp.]MBS5884984.1 ABC transporter ATP-binding protein [Clostridium sp.]MDU7148480.1 ATP-binding cassette domain-containing protein [Clostridium sp.]